MQIPAIQNPMCQSVPPVQPNYNAVKIDINNPQVNTPETQKQVPSAPVTAPMYSYPQAQIYEMPQQSIYQPKQAPVQAPAVKEVPAVPQPVIVQPAVSQTTSPAAPVAPISATAPVAPALPVEVKAPEALTSKIDLNAFIAKLTNPNFDEQANAMETIADMVQNKPKEATELLDVKVVDTLLGIMNQDTSKLEGPTPQQLQIREKIMSGKQVTAAETAEANKTTPMEQAERNKQYSMYTVAMMQKLYGSEIEKLNNTVVPMTELPGAAGIVEQVKNNPNPMVRASGIDALSYIQRPEYKQDLTTIFTVAQNDKDVNVQKVAAKALEKLAQVDVKEAPKAAPETAPAPAAQPVAKKV